MLLRRIIILISAFFFSSSPSFLLCQELVPDSHTFLLLHFNNNLNGAQGETPSTASGITYQTGRFGSGAYINSGDQLRYLTTNNINATAGTFECWFKPDWSGSDATNNFFLHYGDGQRMAIFKNFQTMRLILNQYGQNGYPEINLNHRIDGLTGNQWHHFAYTWAASNMRLFIDGQQVDEATVTIPLPTPSATTFQIGAANNGDYLNAVVDELQISDAPRTPQELLNHYMAGLAVNNITLAPDTLRLLQTWSGSITVTASTDIGTISLPPASVLWSSSNSTIASIDSGGRVTGIDAGTATLTATFQGHSDSIIIIVSAPILPPTYETIDPFLTTPAANAIYDMPVVIISYLPTIDGINLDPAITGADNSLAEMREYIESLNIRVKFMLEEGSKFRGYSNPNARPSLGYRILQIITVYEPFQPGPGGPDVFQPNYDQIITRFNGQHLVDDLGVKEFWIWGYHYGNISPVESNMSSPTTGDISNSYRLNDLPIYSHTYTLYNYNFTRSQAEAVHDHGHQLEAILSHANWLQDGNTNLFWHQFVGQNAQNQFITGRCGWTHMPPNTTADYDYLNPAVVQSDIMAWTPSGGTTTGVNVDTWVNISYVWPYGIDQFPQKDESKWYIFWMQSMPGFNNQIPYAGSTMTNWWTFTGNWDEAIQNQVGLHGSQIPYTPIVVVRSQGNDILLNWNSNGNSAGSVQYRIYRADSLGGIPTLIQTIPDTFFVHIGGATSAKGFYYIQAVNTTMMDQVSPNMPDPEYSPPFLNERNDSR